MANNVVPANKVAFWEGRCDVSVPRMDAPDDNMMCQTFSNHTFNITNNGDDPVDINYEYRHEISEDSGGGWVPKEADSARVPTLEHVNDTFPVNSGQQYNQQNAQDDAPSDRPRPWRLNCDITVTEGWAYKLKCYTRLDPRNENGDYGRDIKDEKIRCFRIQNGAAVAIDCYYTSRCRNLRFFKSLEI